MHNGSWVSFLYRSMSQGSLSVPHCFFCTLGCTVTKPPVSSLGFRGWRGKIKGVWGLQPPSGVQQWRSDGGRRGGPNRAAITKGRQICVW